MLLQWIQTASNIWDYQSRKCFSQNSVITMTYVAMATFTPLHHQLPLKQGTSFWKRIRKQNMSRDMTKQSDCVFSEFSDQPGHVPSLIRVFTIRMKKAWVLSYPLSTQQRLGSDWVDAQADLSLRWVHSHFVGFVMSRLICRFMLFVKSVL